MEMFHLWFTKHFLQHAVPARPLLLLMDGHSSQYCLETIRYVRQHDIILFTLQLHTTHEMQPLDTAVFSSLNKMCAITIYSSILAESIPNTNLVVYFQKHGEKPYVPLSIISDFDDDNNCSLHYLCPCSKCHLLHPPTTNMKTL